jgi:hypothetical protein
MREECTHDRAFDQSVLLRTLILRVGLVMFGLVAMVSARAAAAV